MGVAVALAAAALRTGALGSYLNSLVWYGLQFGTLAALSVIELVLWARSGELRRPPRRALWVLVPSLVFVALAALSSLWAADPLQTLRQVGLLALVFLFLATTYAHRWRSPNVRDGDVRTVFWTAIAVQAVGVGGYFAAQTWAVGDYGRFVGVTANANYAGMGAAVVVALSFALNGLWVRVASIVPLLALVLSDSRGGLVGLLFGLVVVLIAVPDFRRDRPSRNWAIATVACLPVLFLLRALNVFSALRSRASMSAPPGAGGGGGAPGTVLPPPDVTSGRLEIYHDYLQLWLQHPWLGVGYRTPRFSATGVLYEAHNVYLSVLVELGVVGAVVFVLLLVGAFRSAARGSVLIAAAATALALEVTESSIFGLAGPGALMSWLVLFAWASTGLPEVAQAKPAGAHEPLEE